MVSHINAVKPDELVTYAVHGVSRFYNYLVTQAFEKEFSYKYEMVLARIPKGWHYLHEWAK